MKPKIKRKYTFNGLPYRAARFLLKIEHDIYCMTGIELPFHKGYYRRAKHRYDLYAYSKWGE